ncbi:MAG: tricarboxylate transporter [Candidatus Tectimicrobiota bacterium]|nr:MAG: tricarboxylate transporter [Candidatus Tectomicrobia bacterium]
MKRMALWSAVFLLAFVAVSWAQQAFPQRPIEFVIMAGTGGGADRYARFISALVDKHRLSPQPLLPVNRPGGAGAVAMNYVYSKKGDPYVIVITLNSFITTPLIQRLPFSYRDFTPIAMMGLDTFMLWVPADSPFQTAKDLLDAAKARSLTVAGTGSKQEDEILFRTMERRFGLKPFRYVPYKGGGAVAAALVGKQVEATVNNPSEQLSFYKDGRSRPLAVFLKQRVDQPLWKDVPTIKEATGEEIEYVMMRGIFAPGGIPEEARRWLTGLMKKVFATEEFQKFLLDNALFPKFMPGEELGRFVAEFSAFHEGLMRDLGWIQ